METLFPLGQCVITRAAKEILDPEDVKTCLERHGRGDWAEIDDHDLKENQLALAEGLRLFSVYRDRAAVKFYIITEYDRSATTVLLPDDY